MWDLVVKYRSVLMKTWHWFKELKVCMAIFILAELKIDPTVFLSPIMVLFNTWHIYSLRVQKSIFPFYFVVEQVCIELTFSVHQKSYRDMAARYWSCPALTCMLCSDTSGDTAYEMKKRCDPATGKHKRMRCEHRGAGSGKYLSVSLQAWNVIKAFSKPFHFLLPLLCVCLNF